MAEEENGLLTISQVAKLLRVCPSTIRRWWASGEIPAPVKFGGSIRWRRTDIDRFIDQREPIAS